ncbi:MAG TPA: 50S ribosomal protein L6 [Polyangiaceae bacterium]|jgi:large subunit ribosomal protein L6|nr:50S ribosomal protein L6 [Polyangiaceae bacterium]
MATEAVQATKKVSRVGKIPVALPKGVTIKLSEGQCDVKGPKGSLSLKLPPTVQIAQDGDKLVVSSTATDMDAPRLQGLGRALLANVIKGCAEGYERTLELHGVGYRAEQKGQELHFSLGLSHTKVFAIPSSIAVDIPKDAKGAIVHLKSADKAVLGQALATIRSFRPPEPYGGKGVRYRGENIRRKAGKAGKK